MWCVCVLFMIDWTISPPGRHRHPSTSIRAPQSLRCGLSPLLRAVMRNYNYNWRGGDSD